MIVIQTSYREGEYTFFFLRKGSVYLNIRGEGNVIQVSLRGGKCNLLLKYIPLPTIFSTQF